jgi:hypothetical protein
MSEITYKGTPLSELSLRQLIKARENLLRKIELNDGRLTAGSSFDLDILLDQVDAVERELKQFERKKA